MPSVSKAQQEAMAIAEHNPGALHARNKGLLKMSQEQLHDFAATKRNGLPARKSKASARRRLRQADRFKKLHG